MSDVFFEDIEGRIREGERIEEIIEDVADELDNEDFKQDIRADFNSYFQRLRRNPRRIYNFEDIVGGLFEKGLRELGSSSDEFSEYMQEAMEDNEEVADIIEDIIFSWRFFLTFMYFHLGDASPEFQEPIDEVFQQAKEAGPTKLDELLNEQIQWRKFLYGFKRAMSRTVKEGKPREQQLVDKIEIIEELFESVFRPTMYFVAKLVGIPSDYSSNWDHRNTSAIRQRIEASKVDGRRFWDDEALHIRNSSSHNTYEVHGDSVIVIDGDWKEEFSEEELDDKISKLTESSKNTLYALSESYGKFSLDF